MNVDSIIEEGRKRYKRIEEKTVLKKRYGTERCNLGPVCVSGCAGPLRGPYLATQVSAEKEENSAIRLLK